MSDKAMKTTREIQVPGNWYAVDFHVHSPASPDFVPRGIRGKDELYLWMLHQAQEAALDIIVITDHNLVEGYKRFTELHSELKSTERTLIRENVVVPDRIQKQLDLFDQLIILPGVELDIDPNVHMLVLFDPQTSLADMDDFITRAGFHPDIRGQEEVSRYAEWSVHDVCREASGLGAIVIAAHVDSDKGLYEVSKEWGQKRIAAFANESLFGMEFINPVACEQIKSILKQPDYERDTNLAFVQSSDFHGRANQRIGERHTYVRLDGIDGKPTEAFRALKKALRNPAEYVSAPGRPEVQEIQKQLDDVAFVECLDQESDAETLCRFVCAYANSEDGTVVLGRNKNGNWVGIECGSKGDIAEQVNSLVDREVRPKPDLEVEVYPYYGNKYFATVRIKKHIEIYSVVSDDRVYLIEAGEPKRATTEQVVRLAEDRLLERYTHLSITKNLSKISQRLSGERDSIDILPLVRKIEARTMPFGQLFLPPAFGEVLTTDLEKAIEISYNGFTDGNIVVLQPTRPRLRNQYIRITAPLGKCDQTESPFDGLTTFGGGKIVIAPRGGVHLDFHDNIVVACEQWSPLVCSLPKEHKDLDLRFIVAYMKSTIALWYASRCLGSTDLRATKVLAQLPIPVISVGEYGGAVISLVDRLVALEHEFLEAEQAATRDCPGTDDGQALSKWGRERMDAVLKHNKQAGTLMAEIDQLFFEMFGLVEEETKIAQQCMTTIDFMVFGCSSDDKPSIE